MMGNSNGNCSRCLSFTVAIRYGHSGGERRWCISTLELWPPRLQLLEFRRTSGYPSSEVVWPAPLSFTVALSHGHHWAQRRWYISTLELWPSSLQLLQFESTFDYPLSGGLWPDSLVRAKRGHQRSRVRHALLTGMLICTQNPGWERMLSFV
ncbi:expressed unknown protein [Ectocarpus siliculosus]|uniref:Uncharacterized protein n=1 Tax=Ectocarpus siliculosus TaxID=2880 RepID=D7FSZ4_ECTSI|nr:expressed unknown protein [Ectocarpus siliculosus]|eukprot:CBJ31285.1 expressed unknown protein [Ectocarpus siliculosus]